MLCTCIRALRTQQSAYPRYSGVKPAPAPAEHMLMMRSACKLYLFTHYPSLFLTI
ncbi:hypothetical protein HMPREF9248_0821 [Fannyhessea vaginae PB189-T1-4]|uniref:Uncharacterized protein n=1 Tax=Fannyhessea vaginae PB189-T1-4 TaxID=866774 RepID=A0ABP2IYB1_9ACTN|nr:hypothetical protein HMPREF9248_0821 [Fannyhessea vaginae PB189-T1-4]